MDPLNHAGFVENAALLKEGFRRSVDVTDACLGKIKWEQSDGCHPMATVFAQQAMEQAEASDQRRAAGKARSLFDGVPVTVKESLDVKGEDTTLGLPSQKGHPAKGDAVVVQLLKEAGCVLLGKSNVAQALLFNESRNPLFGQTHNPYDDTRAVGGSSGGEAAVIAAYGSPAGFGTDIGGSIRCPAHCCGVVGFKPTSHRISNRGSKGSLPGQEIIQGQVGPMARSVEDVVALLSVTHPLACANRDPRVPPFPLGDPGAVNLQGLRVGVFDDDGMVTPSSSVQRALRESEAALKEAGCELVPFSAPNAQEMNFVYVALLAADGARTLRGKLKRADLDEALALLWNGAKFARPTRKAIAKVLQMSGDPLLAQTLQAAGEQSVAEYWALSARRRELQAECFAAWDAARLDAIISPPMATPALRHLDSKLFSLGQSFSFHFNVADCPAGVVPVTTVQENETERASPSGRLETLAANIDGGSTGLPVGVQVAARPYRDDVVLALMQAVFSRVSESKHFPRLTPPLPGLG